LIRNFGEEVATNETPAENTGLQSPGNFLQKLENFEALMRDASGRKLNRRAAVVNRCWQSAEMLALTGGPARQEEIEV
jgi:hypothetical protein